MSVDRLRLAGADRVTIVGGRSPGALRLAGFLTALGEGFIKREILFHWLKGANSGIPINATTGRAVDLPIKGR